MTHIESKGGGIAPQKEDFNFTRRVHCQTLLYLIGVDCRDLLADEHMEAVILADSQCWTRAFNLASSNAISVSLVES